MNKDVVVNICDITQFEDQLASFEQMVELDRPLRRNAKKRFLLRKGITRTILADNLGKEPHELRFQTAEKGKPFLVGEALEFNLSHSGRYLAIAMSDCCQVGVDLQTNLKDVERFPYMILSEREQALCSVMDREEKEKFLLRIWTCKEALVKAAGDGLTVDVSKIDLSKYMWPEDTYKGSLRYEKDKMFNVCLHSMEFQEYVCSYALIYDTIL